LKDSACESAHAVQGDTTDASPDTDNYDRREDVRCHTNDTPTTTSSATITGYFFSLIWERANVCVVSAGDTGIGGNYRRYYLDVHDWTLDNCSISSGRTVFGDSYD
jgi:hypothetical protein